MATKNFSVPDDVKDRFNQMFAHENKSALVTTLLEHAIARAEHKAHSDAAFMRILAARQQAPKTSTKAILQTRDALRAESDSARELPQR